MVDISIIIVNFNTSDLTLACIKSVISEGSSLKKEIIIVDNGSEDNIVSIIKNRKMTFAGADYKLIENYENLGFSRAYNQGIRAAKGKYVLLLNSDTIVKKLAIKKLLDFAKDHPDAGAVVPRLYNKDGTIQGSIFRLPTLGKTIRQYYFGANELLDKYYPEGDEVYEVESAVMAAFLITPKTIDQVGLLDERYFMFFEDLDYCRKIKKAGLKIYYLPDAGVIHYHGASGKNLADSGNQWRRLIPSSKIYHGLLVHYLIFAAIWLHQKITKLLGIS